MKKKKNEDLATAAVDATPRKQKSRTKTTKMTTTTTVVMDTTITTPTRDVFGRIKYNINNELSSSSSSTKEDVTNTNTNNNNNNTNTNNNNNNKETVSTAVANIARLTHNNNNHNHTNVTHHTNRPIYLSAHRAYVYLLTTIAILAVDFPLFPRRYCKTEIYGYGFMDLGAASFVIVAGWTSVLQHHQYQQSIASGNYYYKVIKKCTPLLLIGLIRLATTKGLEYQEHVSEYGIHWNFFFTLCCIELIMILWKQIKTTLFYAATYISVDLVLGVAFMVTYQLYLSQYGGQEFIVYANRQCFANTNSSLCNAFAANREGILGVIGYCSLRLLSECIAKVCLLTPPPSSSSSSSNDAISSQRRRLFYTSMGLWLLHFLLTVGLHIPNSRRTTNASFILWALAHNTSLLTCIHVVVDKTGNNNKNSDRRLDSEYYTLPWILSSVNDFGLAVFLSSNVLTGLVNLTFDTLHSSNNKAMLILSVYLALVCGFALFLDTLFKRRREKVD
jgi:phosphatidylinositol glycan class W